MSSSKQGPVMFTIVPPNMWPFSGANVRGRLVPTEKDIGQCGTGTTCSMVYKRHLKGDN